MMLKRVKPYDVKSLLSIIDHVHEQHSAPTVIKIQNVLKDMCKYPEKNTCLSQDDIDKIFKPNKGDWADVKTGGGYGGIKRTFKNIKDLMFEDDSDCNRN